MSDTTLCQNMITQLDELILKRKQREAKSNRDLVKLNIKAIRVFNDYDHQRQLHSIDVNEQLLQQAGERKQQLESVDRSKKILFVKRWEVFREKKDQLIQRVQELKIISNRKK